MSVVLGYLVSYSCSWHVRGNIVRSSIVWSGRRRLRSSAVGSWTRAGEHLVEIERQNIVRSAIGIPVAFCRLLTVHIVDIIDGIFRIGIGITHDSDR